ncbi:MAG TPA: hypothetical protein VFS09_01170 [Candidatus Eisenbacteria bacterium]|nr:hypothetical protein [Candidatus Eisenbacteria bacterium]
MRTKLALPVALVLLTGSLSCGLFETRDPVEPGVPSSFPCLTLSSPDNIVANILQAYGKPVGLGCYVSTLANYNSETDPGFLFHPDPADSTDGSLDFTSWTKTIEERVAENIANAARQDSFRLTFKLPYELITSQPDLVIRRYTYEMRFNGSAISDSLFQGLAEISMRRVGGEWQITDWVDRRDPGGTTTRTWGYLRGSYRVGF